ncbi:MAG: penicillin-binding protein 2 [Desulfobacterota bacterium]|nr:penicillin-binding protein 2 [Thermodesulfobacteriota bacterium]
MVKIRTRTELTKNIRIVGLVLLALFAVVSVRVFCLQVVQSEELKSLLRSQHQTTITLAPWRGTIYDRNGSELAVSIEVESLYARPRLIDDRNAVAAQLAPVLGVSEHEIATFLESTKPFVWIRRKLTDAQADAIRELKIDGIGLLKESQRFYPNMELAGQVIGFAGLDTQGLEGIEREYDRILKGTPRTIYVDRDARGGRVFVEGILNPDQTKGCDVVLTIDKTIQYIAEKELEAAVAGAEAKGGIAVVMDPLTGDVLAAASVPRFNPNRYHEASPEVWRNRAVTDVVEPGSTFKSFLVAAALEERVVRPTDMFFCEHGAYRVANKVIHDVHAYGWLDVASIIKHSSNIGVSKIGQQLGRENLYKYIKRFGFTQLSGIQFPGEVPGALPPLAACSEHTQSTIAFGHSITVTPIQLAVAYSALANGGLLMRPTMVKRIVDATGMTVQEIAPLVRCRVISPETAEAMRYMLQQVVAGGTGKRAALPGFAVAGKTGTSEKLDENGYSHSKVLASFAGFVPADDPRITIVVMIDEPQKMRFGGEVAAPAFGKMAHAILHYLKVPPHQSVQGSEPVPRRSWQETHTRVHHIKPLG